MNKIKKVLSLLLSLVMLITITAGIDFSAYAGCLTCSYNSSKKELTIKSSTDGTVTFIPEQYKNAKSLIIAEGIEYCHINDYRNLEKVSFPSTAYQITGISTFGAENKLKTITVSKKNKRYFTYGGALYFRDNTPDGDYYTLIIYPKGKNVSKYKLHPKTDRLESSVFAYTKYLKSVDMSAVNKSIYIESCVFFSSSVETVKMPKKISYIGEQAFALSKLKSISLESSIKTTFDGWGTFRNCSNLAKIILGNKTTALPEDFAINCSKLKSIYIPSSLKSIHYSALGSYIPSNSEENICKYYKSFTIYSNNSKAAINYAKKTGIKHKKASAPKKVSIKSLKKINKGFIASWGKNTKATGYQIQYSTSSKLKNAKTINISKNKTTSKKVTKLKSKKKYYVRIRTYKTYAGKKVYSSWSKVKSVKTK